MKTRIFHILLIVVAFASSCDLKEEPYGFYSDDNFYQTKEDAESALMYAYNAFTYLEYTRGVTSIGDMPTETTDLKPDEGSDAQELYKWTANENNVTLSNYFKYCYIAINRANAVIKNVSDADFVPETKNRILGEARMIRAWSYFSLVRVFGVVPLQKDMVQTVEQTMPALAKDLDEVYDFIIDDLVTAESLLPIGRQVGRFDKVASWAVLSKVYLTIASSKDNNVVKYRDMVKSVDDMYAKAAEWSRKVLYEQTEYYLDTELYSIFDVNKPDGSEHIWLINQDRSGEFEGNYSKTPLMFLPWADGGPFYIQLENGDLVYTTNGWGVYRVNMDFLATFASFDKRRTELIKDAIFDAEGNDAGSVASGKFSNPFTIKYIDPLFVGQKTSVKPFMIRFSDIALVFAEAAGPTAEGLKWINDIRNRAGLSPLSSGMSIDEFRAAVLQERTWEFAYEGQHLYDLRRTGSVISSIPYAKNAGVSEEQAAFYPIPQKELDLNPNISSK